MRRFRKNLGTSWVVTGVICLGLILRLIRIQGRGIWYDDAFSLLLSEQSLGQIIDGTAADTMPPLYYFLLHFWMRVSRQVWFLRSLNLILSLTTIYLVFALGKDLFGEQAGLWAGFITAMSPLHIYHAQEMRMYVLLTLGLLGYIWFFARVWLRPKPSAPQWINWVGLVLCGAAAMYSHNLAIFSIIAPDLFLLFKRQWRLLGKLFIAQLVIGLLALPWLVMVPGQIAKIQSAFWTPQPGLVEIIQAVTTVHSNLPLPMWLLPIALVLSFQILIITCIESVKVGRGDKVQLAAFATLAPPVVMLMLSYFMRPIFVPRAFMLSSLMYYMLIGRAIAKSRARGAGILLGGAFVVLAGLALPYQYNFDEFPRSPFKDMTAVLQQEAISSDIVLHDNKLSYFPARFYAAGLPQIFLPDEAGSHNDTFALASQQAMGIFPVASFDEAVVNRSRVWFVVFEQAIQEYRETGVSDHPVIAKFRDRFRLNQTLVFNDLLVYEFVR